MADPVLSPEAVRAAVLELVESLKVPAGLTFSYWIERVEGSRIAVWIRIGDRPAEGYWIETFAGSGSAWEAGLGLKPNI